MFFESGFEGPPLFRCLLHLHSHSVTKSLMHCHAEPDCSSVSVDDITDDELSSMTTGCLVTIH
jgi:hypothetical protein